jgi:hypothetical protein
LEDPGKRNQDTYETEPERTYQNNEDDDADDDQKRLNSYDCYIDTSHINKISSTNFVFFFLKDRHHTKFPHSMFTTDIVVHRKMPPQMSTLRHVVMLVTRKLILTR